VSLLGLMLRPVCHGDRRAPAVALTFDDGPGAVTGAILEVLRRHGAEATFDVLGERIAGREQLLEQAVRDGHEIGVHGWSHGDHRVHPVASARGAARTGRLVTERAGVRPRVYRPPFGLTSRRLVLAAARHRLRTVLWDVDPRDFEEPGAPAIYDRVVAGVRPGSIVLLHDDRPELAATSDAVDRLLGELHRREWRAVTVSRLLRLGMSEP
jgi:peptidoglycan/xylan/chitin deacetylase (PgdA/CDA1 family)